MSFVYAGALLFSIGSMVLLDHRFRLFFFDAPRRAAVVLAAGIAFFVTWDLVGIALGLFLRGDSPYMTGLMLAPELPVEEIGFLTLLCYLTMNLYVALARRLRPPAGSLADGARWADRRGLSRSGREAP